MMKLLTATIFTAAAFGAATMMCVVNGDWVGVVLGTIVIVLMHFMPQIYSREVDDAYYRGVIDTVNRYKSRDGVIRVLKEDNYGMQ